MGLWREILTPQRPKVRLFLSSRGRWIVTHEALVSAPHTDARGVSKVSAVCERKVRALRRATR